MRIEYHPAVAAELEEVRDYYASRSEGLGDDFVNEFERQVLRIAAMPTRWMVVRRDIRRALMKRFPYVIFFRLLDGDDCIRITVVKHEKRHPSYGAHRH
ncbi:MAG: type II toxin-antitoxin system RelE/ParE family toxin [Verrucomicrobium sp.]